MAGDKICGVNKEIAEQILLMIRDKFEDFDKGTYYLASLGYDNDIGYRNIRDMLSHIKTALSKEANRKEKEIQVSLAEEHLRRALVEPYEVGAQEEFKKTRDLYNKFTKLICSIKENEKQFLKAPAEDKLKEQLKSIYRHMETGRKKKSVNLWNSDWEEAVEEFTKAAEKAQEINNHLEIDIDLMTHRNIHKQNKVYFIWALAATILFGIVSVVGVIMPLVIK